MKIVNLDYIINTINDKIDKNLRTYHGRLV